MKERPVIMASDDVRSILDGTKTQARKIIGGRYHTQPVFLDDPLCPKWSYIDYDGNGEPGHWIEDTFEPILERLLITCPYGSSGTRLWVREALKMDGEGQWFYSADSSPVMVAAADELAMITWAHHKQGDRCPSVQMPHWASRLFLDVVAIRVERVQAIKEEDADAEGGMTYAKFAEMWDEINSKKPGCAWADNPFVWVLEFRRADS